VLAVVVAGVVARAPSLTANESSQLVSLPLGSDHHQPRKTNKKSLRQTRSFSELADQQAFR